MISFKHWFSAKPAHSHQDGLTQPQREAIVDLLNFVTYVDHDISESEEELIDGLETQLDWDHNQSFDYYVDKSIAKARKATDEKDPAFFLDQVAQRLASKQSRAMAVTLTEKLLEADGRHTAAQKAALAAIKKALA